MLYTMGFWKEVNASKMMAIRCLFLVFMDQKGLVATFSRKKISTLSHTIWGFVIAPESHSLTCKSVDGGQSYDQVNNCPKATFTAERPISSAEILQGSHVTAQSEVQEVELTERKRRGWLVQGTSQGQILHVQLLLECRQKQTRRKTK